MSTQINQYLIWGISIPYPKHEDFYEKHQKFMNDSAYSNKVTHIDGIFCLMDGMNGNYCIIGKVLRKTKDGEYMAENKPINLSLFSPFSLLTDEEKEVIKDSVKRNFNLEGEFNLYFLTHYR